MSHSHIEIMDIISSLVSGRGPLKCSGPLLGVLTIPGPGKCGLMAGPFEGSTSHGVGTVGMQFWRECEIIPQFPYRP